MSFLNISLSLSFSLCVSLYLSVCVSLSLSLSMCVSPSLSLFLSFSLFSLPSHFERSTGSALRNKIAWVPELILSIFNNYVVPSLPASLSHHLDWEMDKLVSKHQTFNTRLWTSCLIDALRHNAPTGYAPNEKFGMTAIGIPGQQVCACDRHLSRDKSFWLFGLFWKND